MTTDASSASSRFLRGAAQTFAAPLGALGSISTVAMMIVTTIDVVSRNLSGSSVPGLIELSGTLLIATVFLGLSYAGAANAHVSVDLVTSRFPVSVSRRLAGLMWLLGSAMTVWFIYATAVRALASFQMREIATGLVDWPLWPARWLVVIGFVAFLVIALVNSFLGLRGEPLLGEDDEDDDSEHPSPSEAPPSTTPAPAFRAAPHGTEETS
ncbi:TRAP transporter small permease [Leucobacter sp. M11]|uniref:TRAP transporter small permease n=1 Tax=Leucobacter sp. M11 TaxID=2993565 RepID=UPI002D80E8C0|nr:TRAP transporter small permease [Leucobacter sp. M11]MEB4614943.1 TRAP transporter small permease [Leucobacter sp. M11]